MSSWVVVPCLLALRDEYNRVSPNRDKGADGTIGDSSHTSSSDHTPDEDSDVLRGKDADHVNEVHGLDVDSSGPWPREGWFEDSVIQIVNNHRAGRDDRLQNVIWNHKIASRSWGWTWQPYTATSDPHLNHAHFSSRYTTAQENDTSPWGVADMALALTAEDADVVINRLAARLKSQSQLAEPTDQIVQALRAVGLQYQGGGLPAGASSVLGSISLIATTLTAVKDGVGAIVANVQADDQEKAQLLADAKAKFDALQQHLDQAQQAVHQVPSEVVSMLADQSKTDIEVADALRAVLGNRAASVGAYLQVPA